MGNQKREPGPKVLTHLGGFAVPDEYLLGLGFPGKAKIKEARENLRSLVLEEIRRVVEVLPDMQKEWAEKEVEVDLEEAVKRFLAAGHNAEEALDQVARVAHYAHVRIPDDDDSEEVAYA